MKITKRSPFSGEMNTMEIDVTEEQIKDLESGTPIEEAMPNLIEIERQFLSFGYIEDDILEMIRMTVE